MTYPSTPAGASQAAQAPLTEQEQTLVTRLLSDPSYFPREFKQWVTDHASDSVDIAKGQVHGLINSSGELIFTDASWGQLGAVLVGVILPWGASLPPAVNWLRCDGSYYLQSAYPNLYSLIGHAHDTTTIAGQFAIPDCRGRAIYGYADSGSPAFAAHDSAGPSARGPAHSHTMLQHLHGMAHTHGLAQDFRATGGAGVATGPGSAMQTGGPSNSFTDVGGPTNTSGPSALVDAPGWIGLNYIIATGNMP
jgi:microcystin-dependent protein